MNRLPTALLRSRRHGALSARHLLIEFTGRRTGTRYATPVQYLQRGDEVVFTTAARWGANLDGGADVVLFLRGRRIECRAATVTGADAVEIVDALIRDHPPYRFWTKVAVHDGVPDADDIRAALARGRRVIRVDLTDQV